MTNTRYLEARESDEQIALFQWAAFNVRKYKQLSLLYHIPNGGKRDKGTAQKLKAEGVKAGVPDVHLPVARGNHHGLYIEMKYGNNKTTEYQRQWLKSLEEEGHKCAVCYGWQEAANLIVEYLNSSPGEEA